ncbi:MAG TPA: bifunctional adenosylcobinamide kinase/adenosylcobinamide-phosphate guanylyltransferase [Steroidobacteraceae bacterium]|jgi:adenosylcobinamide kinase/adenosylcobinamide-phosphate guanylyltransferase|nr:bifunctional adenosylcobinamide kinase/adenosylcobinamide-phosphate guanylyltransferase [Steroidobacteraceae bacterium]
MKELVLGGVRSGKSRYAEQQARASGLRVVYLATALAGGDAELEERIRRHRSYRPADWVTVEEPAALGAALRTHASAQSCVLVECLTLWLAHLLTSGSADRLEHERSSLLRAAQEIPGHLILVSNETGLGVMPPGELSRRFLDLSGELHQSLAAACDRVTLVLAGLPQPLKGGHP